MVASERHTPKESAQSTRFIQICAYNSSKARADGFNPMETALISDPDKLKEQMRKLGSKEGDTDGSLFLNYYVIKRDRAILLTHDEKNPEDNPVKKALDYLNGIRNFSAPPGARRKKVILRPLIPHEIRVQDHANPDHVLGSLDITREYSLQRRFAKAHETYNEYIRECAQHPERVEQWGGNSQPPTNIIKFGYPREIVSNIIATMMGVTNFYGTHTEDGFRLRVIQTQPTELTNKIASFSPGEQATIRLIWWLYHLEQNKIRIEYVRKAIAYIHSQFPADAQTGEPMSLLKAFPSIMEPFEAFLQEQYEDATLSLAPSGQTRV